MSAAPLLILVALACAQPGEPQPDECVISQMRPMTVTRHKFVCTNMSDPQCANEDGKLCIFVSPLDHSAVVQFQAIVPDPGTGYWNVNSSDLSTCVPVEWLGQPWLYRFRMRRCLSVCEAAWTDEVDLGCCVPGCGEGCDGAFYPVTAP